MFVTILARSCPSRHEPALLQGFPIPADNVPNELALVCHSLGQHLQGGERAQSRFGLSFALRYGSLKVDLRISGHVSSIKLNGKNTVFLCPDRGNGGPDCSASVLDSDSQLVPGSRRLSRSAHSAVKGGGRRRLAGMASASSRSLLFGSGVGFILKVLRCYFCYIT